jgi:hypothetical protein
MIGAPWWTESRRPVREVNGAAASRRGGLCESSSLRVDVVAPNPRRGCRPFQARKSLEEFDFDQVHSLRRDTISHLGGLDFTRLDLRGAPVGSDLNPSGIEPHRATEEGPRGPGVATL